MEGTRPGPHWVKKNTKGKQTWATKEIAVPWVSLVILSFAITRHRLIRRTMPELIRGDSRTDMLISHRVVLTSTAIMEVFHAVALVGKPYMLGQTIKETRERAVPLGHNLWMKQSAVMGSVTYHQVVLFDRHCSIHRIECLKNSRMNISTLIEKAWQ